MTDPSELDYQSRDVEAYARAYLALLPTGAAWPKTLTSLLGRLAVGLCGVVARFDQRAMEFLRRECDPRTTTILLPIWEKQVGLPDECTPVGATLEERRALVTARWTAQGGASRNYFISVAETLGYEIEIIENKVGIFGVNRFGSARFGPPQMRYWWTVRVQEPRLTWARFSGARFGVTPHLQIRRAQDLECLFEKLKPSHTKIRFEYLGA